MSNILSKNSLQKLEFLCLTGLLLLSSNLRAATVIWDPNSTVTGSVGGNGNWDTTTALWSTGAADQVWNNAAVGGDIASITGPSTISVTTGITLNGITTAASSVSAISGSTLTFVGSTPTITAGSALTISSAIAGSAGFTKAGAGTLTISGTNTYTGTTTISANTLKVGSATALPTTTTIAFGGSARTLDTNGFNISVAGLSGSNGVLTNSSSASDVTVTINGSTNTNSGVFIQDGSGGKVTSLVKQGSSVQYLLATSSTGNTYTGSTTVSGGTLRLSGTSGAAASTSLYGTSSVLVNGGILTNNVGNSGLGTGDLTLTSGGITPGDAGTIGSFTLAASKSIIASGGTLKFDLGAATTAGTTYDAFFGSGAGSQFTLTGTTIDLTGLAGLDLNATYNIFSGFSSGTALTSSSFTYTGSAFTGYTASLSSAGVLSFTAVPEPSTFALLGVGLAGLWALRRRNKNAV